MCKSDDYIFALSQKDIDLFIAHGKNPDKLILCKNGSNHSEIQPRESGKFNDKSVYIAKIEERKRQYMFQTIPDVDFYGPCGDNYFKMIFLFVDLVQIYFLKVLFCEPICKVFSPARRLLQLHDR
jgi:hypothetical protein